MNWKNEGEKGNVSHWNLSRSLLFVGYGCLRAQPLSLPSWAGIIDLVSLKRVRSRFNAWNLCAPCALRLFEILNFFFFENFCVANGSDVSVKCYSNSVSERFFFFLCQVERTGRFFEYFSFRKEVSKSLINFRCL